MTTILNITGASGAGKTTALQSMNIRFGGVYIEAPRGGAVAAKSELVALPKGTERLYVDIERQPTPSFLKFVKDQAAKKQVKHLVIAHS